MTIQRTHWDDCWKSGPEHYECAVGEVERLRARDEEWQRKASAWMASPEATQWLDGYRELAQKLNAAEAEAQKWKTEYVRIAGDYAEEASYLRKRAERAEAAAAHFNKLSLERAVDIENLQAEVERLRAEVNEFRRVLRSVVRYDVGYEWDGTKMCHTPLLKIEFSDVPAGEPNTAVGWLDRDAFSASIDAARGES